jgi:hypothetical protein
MSPEMSVAVSRPTRLQPSPRPMTAAARPPFWLRARMRVVSVTVV